MRRRDGQGTALANDKKQSRGNEREYRERTSQASCSESKPERVE